MAQDTDGLVALPAGVKLEAGTQNMERTDVVIDYAGEQYIVELKNLEGKRVEGCHKILLFYDSLCFAIHTENPPPADFTV